MTIRPEIIRVIAGACTLAVMLLSSLSLMAGTESASLMTFSTVGPDCYADGTEVLDGEYYALVWQTEAAGDVKFTMSGAVADCDDAVVLRALPRAKGGKCRLTSFAIDSARLPKLSATGMLKLYLLDTRVFVDGVARDGGLESVQASVPVTATCKVTTGSTAGALAVKSFAASQLSSDVPSPRITGISVAEDFVTLTIADTVDGINYTTVDPFTGKGNGESAVVTGKTGAEVQLKVPCGKSTLFRVERK